MNCFQRHGIVPPFFAICGDCVHAHGTRSLRCSGEGVMQLAEDLWDQSLRHAHRRGRPLDPTLQWWMGSLETFRAQVLPSHSARLRIV